MHVVEPILMPLLIVSFLFTTFLVYKLYRNSELAKTDESLPVEQRIKIKKIELIVEVFFYSLLFLIPFSLVFARTSFSVAELFVLVGLATALILKIKKALRIKYAVIEELSKTKS